MAALGPARIRVAAAQSSPRAKSKVGAPPDPETGGDASAIAAPNSMLDAFLVTVVRLTGARAGAVRALCANGDRLRLVAAFGLPEDVLEREALIDPCGVCGDAMHADGVQVADSRSRCGKLAVDNFFENVCTGTVAVPLEYKGRSVGVFTLFFDDVHTLRGEVIHLLRPVGQLFGLALENAQLEQENLQASLLQERQAMAAEIHDSLAQSLTFVRMRMPLLRDAVSRQDEARALRYCNDLDQELGSANRRMRELITHFRAGMGAQGLEHALGQTAGTFREQTGIPLEFDCRIPGFDLPADQEVQIFHMVQEALANVRRHSGARSVTLWVDRSGDELVFGIDDDGSGFPEPVGAGADATAVPSSFGLEIMRQRAQSIGAKVSFERAPGRGARVTIRVPFAGLKSGAAEAVAEVSRG